MGLVLYGSQMWNSPYVLSAFVALTEKGLPFEVKVIALHQGAQHAAPYTDLSLTSRVPALADGAFTLAESSAIIEYLEDRFPAPEHPRVLPADVQARARARQVMAWVRSDVGALRDERSAEYVFYPASELAPLAPLTKAGQRAADKVIRFASALVPEGGGPLFGGWCIADTDLAMMLWRLSRTGHPLPAKLKAFADREWERPSVRAFATKPRPAFVAY
jgi:glutathione S-transferase